MVGALDNWIWAQDPLDGGPCIIVDVDGVISDGAHRQRFLRNGRRDWQAFFEHAVHDVPIEGSAAMIEHFDRNLAIVMLTARPNWLLEVTVGWLTGFEFRWDLLILRHRDDVRLSSPEFKRRSLAELRARDFDPRLALDDDRRNTDMYREEGVETLYVHSGYYEA